MANHPSVPIDETRTTDFETFIRCVKRNTDQIRLLHSKITTNADRLFGAVPTTGVEKVPQPDDSGNVVQLTNVLADLEIAVDHLEHELDRFSNL